MGMGAVSPGRAVGCGADPAVLRAPYDRKYPSLGSLAAEGAHLVVPGVLGSVQAVVRLVGERGTPGDGQARGEGGERGSAEYGLVAARERWGSRRRDRPVSGREGGEGDGSGPSLPGPKTSGAPAHLQAPDEEDAPSTAAVEAKRAPACGNRGGRISLFRRASGTAGPEAGPVCGDGGVFSHIRRLQLRSPCRAAARRQRRASRAQRPLGETSCREYPKYCHPGRSDRGESAGRGRSTGQRPRGPTGGAGIGGHPLPLFAPGLNLISDTAFSPPRASPPPRGLPPSLYPIRAPYDQQCPATRSTIPWIARGDCRQSRSGFFRPLCSRVAPDTPLERITLGIRLNIAHFKCRSPRDTLDRSQRANPARDDGRKG